MFQEGEEALEEEVEGEEGTVETKGQVVLLGVDELVPCREQRADMNISASSSGAARVVDHL